MTKSRNPRGHVVTCSASSASATAQIHSNAQTSGVHHEIITLRTVAERLAALSGREFAGEFDPTAKYGSRAPYLVPADTLLHEQARRLGIHSEDHFFGGSVPLPFMATKTITHPLVSADASTPPGWLRGFADSVADVVLEGHSVFSPADAHTAANLLLHNGAVRVKPALGIGGCGQTVITDTAQLDAVLAALDTGELAQYGVVLEQDLQQVITFSVGRARLAGMAIAYYGTQHLTANQRGENVYGGSTLHVTRGDFAALLSQQLPPDVRLAVTQAQRYDVAADAHFPGFLASRRNYDVVLGVDNTGRARSGVLEQSWRVGGASPAEIAAFEAFVEDPELQRVQTSSCERYGDCEPPANATLYFRGVDVRVGQLIKYSTIDNYEYFAE